MANIIRSIAAWFNRPLTAEDRRVLDAWGGW